MELWIALKYLHILSVIAALGANLTYLFWFRRAGESPQQLVFVIQSVRRLDNAVANPAYMLAALFGVGIVATGPYPLSTPWILAAIVLYVLVALVGIAVYAPAMRTQLDLAQRAPESAAYAAAARRSRRLFFVPLGLVLVIVWLMVAKPALWG